jgi:indolepyruvate ferredoxin oxidoreductase
LSAQFDGNYKLKFHLAPPLFSRKDPSTGLPRKREFGSWMLSVFKLLKKGKGLRGGKLDIFGYSHERQTERKLIVDYQAMIRDLLRGLTPDTLPIAIKLAELPDEIRGFGYVKEANLAKAEAMKATLLQELEAPAAASRAVVAAA